MPCKYSGNPLNERNQTLFFFFLFSVDVLSLKASLRLSSVCWLFPLVVNHLLQASLEQTRGKERIGRLVGVSMLKSTKNKTHETYSSSVN